MQYDAAVAKAVEELEAKEKMHHKLMKEQEETM